MGDKLWSGDVPTHYHAKTPLPAWMTDTKDRSEKEKAVGAEQNRIHSLTEGQRIRLAAVKIREAIKAGPDKASLSTTESCMVAIAACDRSYLLKALEATPTHDLWDDLDGRQRAAVLHYFNAEWADVSAVGSEIMLAAETGAGKTTLMRDALATTGQSRSR